LRWYYLIASFEIVAVKIKTLWKAGLVLGGILTALLMLEVGE
jgi:hypothetical protein